MRSNTSVMTILTNITQILFKYECTYNESDIIINLLQDWIKQSRENKEYNTVSDYVNEHKSKCIDNLVIEPLNHVEGYF